MNNFDKSWRALAGIDNHDLPPAILTILNYVRDAGDGNISHSWGNIGIDVTKYGISIVDIEAGKELISLRLEVNENA
jgi:hypothetical protein